MVKEGMEKSAFEYLCEIQKSHSKARPIVYENFEMQEYLSSQKFSTEYRNLLFRLRTRTVQGIKVILKDGITIYYAHLDEILKKSSIM